jgi:hypothetical protein
MIGLTCMWQWRLGGAKAAAALFLLVGLVACTASAPSVPPPGASAEPPPDASAEPPPSPSPPAPPPIDLAGKWRLSAAGGASCLMTFGDNPGATEGSIAPAGGCPGNFFTSRKWTFEHGALIIRDYKGQPLLQLSYSADHFEGQSSNGTSLTLSR